MRTFSPRCHIRRRVFFGFGFCFDFVFGRTAEALSALPGPPDFSAGPVVIAVAVALRLDDRLGLGERGERSAGAISPSSIISDWRRASAADFIARRSELVAGTKRLYVSLLRKGNAAGGPGDAAVPGLS